MVMSRRDCETYVFDSFNIEIIIKVFRFSVFSPFFAIFVPLMLRGQGYSWSSLPCQWAIAYAVLIYLYAFSTYGVRLALSPHKPYPPWNPPRIQRWEDELVLITGGAGGVGGLLAETLAMRGVSVVVLDIKEGEWERDAGRNNISFYKCDVSSKAEVEHVARQIQEELGDPTMLINNAGIVHGKKILDLTERDVNETIGVNLISHFWTIQAFLPGMLKAKRGHIMTVSSVMGMVGSARLTDYTATKAALLQLHESLRFELDSQYNAPKILTSLVIPSVIHTRLFSTSTLTKSRVFRFFSPELEPHQVVKRMVAVLSGAEGETIMMPNYVKFVPYVRWLPGVRELLQWFTGADHALDGFVRYSNSNAEASSPAGKSAKAKTL